MSQQPSAETSVPSSSTTSEVVPKANPFHALPKVTKEQLLAGVEQSRLESILSKTHGLFPLLDDIKDLRTALKIVRNDLEALKQPFPYVEKHENNMAFFNYNYMTWFTFGDLSERKLDDEISEIRRAAYLFARECRGVCYDLETGACASRGLQKFFNVGEKPETEPTSIDFTENHIILDKMDGTMVCSILAKEPSLNDANKRLLRFRTKMGWVTDPSKLAEAFIYGSNDASQFPVIDMSNDEYRLSDSYTGKFKSFIEFSIYWIKKGYSPIFELVSPQNQIVLLYDHTSLVLLGIRNNYDGHYVSYEETRRSCEEFGVEYTKPLASLNSETNLENVLKFIKEQIGIEGFVIRFEPSGKMYKIKCSWYLELHSCKTDNKKISDTDIWWAVLQNTVDDIQSNLQTKEMKTELEDFVSNFWNALNSFCQKIIEKGTELREKYPTKKEYFAQGVLPLQKETNKLYSEFVSGYFDWEDDKVQEKVLTKLIKKLEPTVNTKKKVKNNVLQEIRECMEQVTEIKLNIFESKYLEEKKRYDETLKLRREQQSSSRPQIYDAEEQE
ncbi:hypothetical protein NAEGRDRAFT_78709 [Naegleria gruberi]|uniref:T4 RNA ligase 1-like N-terminal domain-containing protein n=1 Tax=Naegleria gruberi TaxID=5762 RepID=D2V5W9_NAEGR|nr:uncharacterized protein NAEGRDRAFT_78709 [Naegleria gruberi]EFC47871.1 hypothetical protein NAEGRDRAFT_78709 [Naegleria gruberi]|eukprot:XP_002680615.1 hypothetical protein NAEGRDRAFT_78709 [Naegleria gruberi strain NEG-M]